MKTGKELVISAIRLETTERVPWVPFVGCHGGSLIDVGADEYLKDADLIVKGQVKAAKLYEADGIPVSFDLQVEAEALGCDLKWEKLNPPAVSSHVLDTKKLNDLTIPGLDAARIPIMMDAAIKLRKELPDTALYGLITGPFTLALHLMGSNLFMEMYDDPEGPLELLKFCTDVGKVMINGYIDAGCDIIALVDPMTSQISPDHFSKFVTPGCTELFSCVRDKGKLSSFFVCGHALKNLEVMCDCKPDNLSVDENIPLDVVKRICLERGVSFGGNLRLTTALLNGTEDQNSIYAFEALRTGGTTGYIIAPGCDIPYDTPIANLQAVAGVTKDDYKRQVAETLAAEGFTEKQRLFDMSEYGRSEKVIVDIITLDSEACAPCQYMVESVKAIVPQFEDLVIWREHKIKSPESVQFMSSLMVKNVPTICIDGAITFVSVIPTRDELIAALQARINKKLRIKIRRKQSKIIVLTDDSDLSREAVDNAQTAITELGVDVDLIPTDDKKLADEYGIKKFPAVIVCTSQLKTWSEAPEVKIIKEWLKDLS
ncbi:MAG: uroporphyrinogen decarboxylase family protein [Clostridiales bacterium]|nr:uroporphyrinogen decarboxylase family protein [Clostridiales bacterium]